MSLIKISYSVVLTTNIFIFLIYKKGQIRKDRLERKVKSTIENINCFNL